MVAQPHGMATQHSPTELPHLHERLQQTLRQGPKGTPVLWLLVLSLRLLQQSIDIWEEARRGKKQPQTQR